ncbi:MULTISPECIES: toll/interleukin-1 receptor domain-containing protein [Serratia]|uniref:toll/interleukin-1 receptor domain-containing protein n=1 Tax=Serratia TaxID=613 RepID=UPI00136498B1|nr:toll/interleukin-1 receptor domain-containing protein [Serratia marcescens]EME9755064.1 toll/interleukin-1 receptor domain-containing protein [Serratia marcescens]
MDKLAIQLVHRNVNVWLDRWELSIGDSIIDKVQDAVDGASALLVILSKASIASAWCKRELSSGVLRELEEKRVVVMPVLLEDCDIPLFARGKLYADFRTNFDDGLRTVVEGIAKVTSPFLARAKEPEYHVDWSIDWGDVNGLFAIILNFVEQAQNQPYTCLTNIEVLCSPVATEKYEARKESIGEEHARAYIVRVINEYFQARPDFRPLLVTEREKVEKVIVAGSDDGEEYRLRIGVRRLGEDTGRDVLVNTTMLIAQSYEHMSSVLKRPDSEKA